MGNAEIGENYCAWKAISLVKSISLDCLEQVGFLEACEEDQFNFPFANAAIVLGNALNQSDSSLGGCPALPPPSIANLISEFKSINYLEQKIDRSIGERYGDSEDDNVMAGRLSEDELVMFLSVFPSSLIALFQNAVGH